MALEAALLAAMASAGEMQWGKDDCGLWFANIVVGALGYDPAAQFRGRYRTRIGARRVLGKNGLLGNIKVAARRHGWKRIKPCNALPGDIGMAWVEAGDRTPVLATVICRDEGWFVGRNEFGWTAIPASHTKLAWSIL